MIFIMFELIAIGVFVSIALAVDKTLQRNMVVPPPRRTELRDIVKKKLDLDQMFVARRIDVAAYIRGLTALGLSRPDATRKFELICIREADTRRARGALDVTAMEHREISSTQNVPLPAEPY
jgi:hypothetical protein